MRPWSSAGLDTTGSFCYEQWTEVTKSWKGCDQWFWHGLDTVPLPKSDSLTWIHLDLHQQFSKYGTQSSGWGFSLGNGKNVSLP